jgi:hypothetical protein
MHGFVLIDTWPLEGERFGEAIGAFRTAEDADHYRLKMWDPERWAIVRLLLRDIDRDFRPEFLP